MKHTVIALFDHAADAQQAAANLTSQGFGSTAVHVGEPPEVDTAGTQLSPATIIEGGTGVRGGLLEFFSNLFGVDDVPHASRYDEAVRRGGTLVSVHADDEAQAASARDALLAAGAVNIDDRAEEWRQGGWEGGGALAGAAAGVAVHRREVSIGGVHVYGHGVVRTFDDYADDFRTDYAARYAALGGSYDDYDRAYRYGHGLASDARYSAGEWDDIEADVRSDWERRHPDSAWERFKGAVRHAWERVTR